MHAHHFQRLAGVIAYCRAFRQYPAITAVAVLQTVGIFELRRQTFQIIMNIRQHALVIDWMNTPVPTVDMIGQLGVGVAQHVFPGR